METAVTVTRFDVAVDARFSVPYEGSVGATLADFPEGFRPSFGSGLAFKGVSAAGELEFYGLTDRGPNGDGPRVPSPFDGGTMDSKIFPAPAFVPAVGIISVGAAAAISSVMPLKLPSGAYANGLPHPPDAPGFSGEVPLLNTLTFDPASKARFDPDGIDSEAIAFDSKRQLLWIADEYGPNLWMVDAATGVMRQRYAPGSGLPAIFASRRANRGMEGMTYDAQSDTIHAFLQSPLTDPRDKEVERRARFARWIEFDPNSGTTTRMFACPLDPDDYQDGRTGNAKLGDIVALGGGRFVVIEQGAGAAGAMLNRLVLLDLDGATDISAAAFNPETFDLERSSIEAAQVNGADWTRVVPMKRTVLLDLRAFGWVAEKAEGLALVDGAMLAVINDNDFGLATRIFTPAGQMIDGADVTECEIGADGAIVDSDQPGCRSENTIRVTRGHAIERPLSLWLIRFPQPLLAY